MKKQLLKMLRQNTPADVDKHIEQAEKALAELQANQPIDDDAIEIQKDHLSFLKSFKAMSQIFHKLS